MPQMTECQQTATHQAHMAINGECPMCGEYNPDQTEFMSVEEAEENFG